MSDPDKQSTLATEQPPLNPGSDGAQKMMRWLKKRVETLRDELERDGTDVQHLRGAIAEHRRTLRLLKPEPVIEGTDSTY